MERQRRWQRVRERLVCPVDDGGNERQVRRAVWNSIAICIQSTTARDLTTAPKKASYGDGVSRATAGLGFLFFFFDVPGFVSS